MIGNGTGGGALVHLAPEGRHVYSRAMATFS